MKRMMKTIAITCFFTALSVNADMQGLEDQLNDEYQTIKLHELIGAKYIFATNWEKKSNWNPTWQNNKIKEELDSIYSEFNNIEENDTLLKKVVYEDKQVCTRYEKVKETILNGRKETTRRKSTNFQFSLTSAVGGLVTGFAGGAISLLGVGGAVGGLASAGGFFDTDSRFQRKVNHTEEIVGYYRVNEDFKCADYDTYTRGKVLITPDLLTLNRQLAVELAHRTRKEARTAIEDSILQSYELVDRIISNPVLKITDYSALKVDGEALYELVGGTPLSEMQPEPVDLELKQAKEVVKRLAIVFRGNLNVIYQDYVEYKKLFGDLQEMSLVQSEIDAFVSVLLSFQNKEGSIAVAHERVNIFNTSQLTRLMKILSKDTSVQNSIENNSIVTDYLTEIRSIPLIRFYTDRLENVSAFKGVVSKIGNFSQGSILTSNLASFRMQNFIDQNDLKVISTGKVCSHRVNSLRQTFQDFLTGNNLRYVTSVILHAGSQPYNCVEVKYVQL